MEKLTASKKTFLFLLIIAVSLMAVMACTVTAQASMGFSVTPKFPSNQRDGSGFFDLRLSPGQEQELILTVTNSSDTEIAVEVEAFTVSTSSSGSVDYSTARANDATLKHSISDLITIPEPRTVIPAGSQRDVVLHLTAPDEAFEGVLLGSLRVLREPTEQELEEAGAIINRFAHAMAIMLRMDDTEVQTDFALGDVASQITNARASVAVDVRNPQPKLVKNVVVQASVVEIESGREIFGYSLDDVEFAPNSIFPLTFVDRAGYGISAGSYKVYVTLEHNGQKWELEKDFEIAPAQASAVNAAALNQTQQAPPTVGGNASAPDFLTENLMTLTIIGVGVLLIAVVILPMAARQRRKSNEMMLQMQERLWEIQNRKNK